VSLPGALDVTGLILAGGKATRLGGITKHLLVVDGQTIFERQVALLAPRVAEILVATPHDIVGFRTVHDAQVGVGPLAGIAAGLAECRTEWMLVIAGDMPYLTGELLDDVIAARGDDGVKIYSEGLPEPLVCLLHIRTRDVIDQRIASGRYKASEILTDGGLTMRRIDVADRSALRNINSPEDL
jgi:molybdenum cofactor guanylyltransferase